MWQLHGTLGFDGWITTFGTFPYKNSQFSPPLWESHGNQWETTRMHGITRFPMNVSNLCMWSHGYTTKFHVVPVVSMRYKNIQLESHGNDVEIMGMYENSHGMAHGWWKTWRFLWVIFVREMNIPPRCIPNVTIRPHILTYRSTRLSHYTSLKCLKAVNRKQQGSKKNQLGL